MSDDYLHAAEVLRTNVAKHEMTVLHDEGIYRHIRFQRTDTSVCYFDLLTWPGHLAISGDIENFVFARLNDMFTFFRARSGWSHDTINPGYWAEKIKAGYQAKEYSETLLRQLIADTVHDNRYDYPGLGEYIDQKLEEADEDGTFAFEDTAREWLGDFRYVVPHVAPVRSFTFSDAWEWNLCDWSHHYLYACHAIQWGIEQYDKAHALVGAS